MQEERTGWKEQIMTGVLVTLYLTFLVGYGTTVFKIDSWTKPAHKTAFVQTE